MALPEDVTTCRLTFGPYTDASGEPVLVGLAGKIKPSVSPIRHAESGAVVIDAVIPVVIDEFGAAEVELAHTDQDVLSPVGFTYTVTWNVASRKQSPGNRQIALPQAAGAEVDFDLLAASEDVEGVLVPIGATGPQGPAGVADDASVAALVPGPGLTATALRAASGPSGDLRAFNVFRPENYGAVGDGTTDDTAAFAAVVAAMPTGARLRLTPGKTYLTAGGHSMPLGSTLDGLGADVIHSGNNICFDFNRTGSFNGTIPSGVQGLRLTGNAGVNAIGVEFGNAWGNFLRDAEIRNYGAGIALHLHNLTNWCEGVVVDNVKIDGTLVGVRFHRSPSGAFSFGYTRLTGVSINVPANGIGIDVGSLSASAVYLYHADIAATIWLLGNNATAMTWGANSTMDSSRLYVRGEIPGNAGNPTGCVGLKNLGGAIKAFGHFLVKDAANDTTLGATRITAGYRGVDTMAGTSGGDTFRALVLPNPDLSHDAMFGYLTATNTSTPFVSAYDQSTDSFRIYKVPFGGNLATATLVCRVDKNGALFPGGGSTGVYSGAGSPEGAVSAAVGSVYLRNNGGPYTSLYLKTTTGTSGWHAVRSRDDIRISGEGLGGEAYPRQSAVGTMATTSGVLFGTLIGTAPQDRLTNVHCLVATAGSGLTLVRLGYYARTGQLLASTGDVSASFTSTGAKTFAFTSSYLTPAPGGGGYLGILQVGTTPATLRSGAVMASSEMAAFGSGVPSSASLGSGLTDLPSPASAVNAAGSSPWFGWS